MEKIGFVAVVAVGGFSRGGVGEAGPKYLHCCYDGIGCVGFRCGDCLSCYYWCHHRVLEVVVGLACLGWAVVSVCQDVAVS